MVESQELGLSMDERRRMLAANSAAVQYYRRELLRATGGWPLEYLKAHGVESVLSTASPWQMGYAPPTWSNLVNHLRAQGFGYGTLVRAGLMSWNDHDEAIDQHRDKLLLVAHDRRLAAVGFVGIEQDGQVQPSPLTAVHRPANVLVGVEEQRDLLHRGAVPVIVDSPMDAIAVSEASRQLGGHWAAIPLCGGSLSTSQAKMLREFSTSDKVLIVLSGSEAKRDQAAGHVLDLAFFFKKVGGISLPPGETLAGLRQKEFGTERLNGVLQNSRPLMTYRASGRGFVALQSADMDPPAPSF